MTPAATSVAGTARKDRNRALALATVAFAVNFWAWGLIAPLAPEYQALLDLTSLQTSVMVAVPVLLGSLARIPLGALTDRFGGRLVFGVLSLAVVAPVVFLATAESYPALLAGGLLLGLGGASFAVGVPFVNAWFPPERRGLALGIYGLGNLGTAIAGFTAPGIAAAVGRPVAYLVVAVALAAVGVVFLAVGRDAPGRQPSTTPFLVRFGEALRMRVAVDLSALYAITFGGFVAFGVYLPTYLREVYTLDTADAAARAGGFILLATLFRPVGGGLSDRWGGPVVLAWGLAVVGVGAIVVAFEPGIVVATAAFLAMAAALGSGNGAVFALVGQRIPADRVGSVTGLVGAAGGLGGFLPPIVMGLVLQATGAYAIGLMLLSNVAFAGLIYTWWRFLAASAAEDRSAGLR